MKSLFVTGTDTGVGKTLVTALLALKLRACGVDCGVMKPIASGCDWRAGELVSDDALWLREVTGVTDEMSLINPIRLEKPLAPLVAARLENRTSDDFISSSIEALRELQRRHEVVIVEGVGGLMVPIGEQNGKIVTCVDLANALRLPIIVVARRALGTINHTLLTCSISLQNPGAHSIGKGGFFAGLVFCDSVALEDDDLAAATSPRIIAEMTGLPVWGEIPFLNETSRAAQQRATDFINVDFTNAARRD